MPIIARWILALIVAFVAITLAVANHTFGDVDFSLLATKAAQFASRCGYWFMPGAFITTALYSWTGKPRLAFAYFICTLVYFSCSMVQAYWPATARNVTFVDYVLLHLITLTSPWHLMPLTLLFLVRFRGKLDTIRIVTMALILIDIAATIIYTHMPDVVFLTLYSTVTGLLLVALIVSAWCIAFRRKRSRSTLENIRLTTLYCPSCDAILTPVNPRECQCPHCHLHLKLDFNESHCKKCRYPLQGLTSNNCPECGEPLVHTTTPDSVPI